MKAALAILTGVLLWSALPLALLLNSGRRYVFLFGFDNHKRKWKYFLPNGELKWKSGNTSNLEFLCRIAPRLLFNRQSEVLVWGFKHPPIVERFCRTMGVRFVRVEDGFLRSVSLGADRSPPISLSFDSRGIYFDPTRTSDLEHILQNSSISVEDVERARQAIAKLLSTGLSKYNTGERRDALEIYGEKSSQRVLVLGQVEGDMSLIKGCQTHMTNNDLVWLAARENPNAQIIYKPHPEVLRGYRNDPPQSNPQAVEGVALVLSDSVSLADSFRTIDRAYTMTSLSGFEALLRGIPVTCIGMPFYAGWGLTDDRMTSSRRTRRRSIEEVFAAAYILYPSYYDPILQKSISFEEAIDLLSWMKSRMSGAAVNSRQYAVNDRGSVESRLIAALREAALPSEPS